MILLEVAKCFEGKKGIIMKKIIITALMCILANSSYSAYVVEPHSLETQPDEVIIQIMQNLSDQDLARFAQTSKRYQQLAQPMFQERKERIKQRNMFIPRIKGSKLNLAKMDLQYLIPGVFDDSRFKKIKELNLDNNQLKTIDPQTFAGLNLRVLSLANNQLTAIDTQPFANLQRLDLSNNQLTTIDTQPFANLQRLNLDNNRLTAIDTQPFANLQWLYLDNNRLTTIDTQPFANLQRLYLDNNRLTTIDIQPFGEGSKLKELYLENNQLTQQTRIMLEQLRERRVMVVE